MNHTPDVVVFGATGYTGTLVAEALVARGARPVLAGRSRAKLDPLAERLGGLETRLADVSEPRSVQALVRRGDVLVSTVGPFGQWGRPALDAALSAHAHYIDTCGESPFIQAVLARHDEALAAGCTLLPAFGYDYVPGALAGLLALREVNHDATSLDVGYFASGPLRGGLSAGTRATAMAALPKPILVRRDGRVVSDRVARRVRKFTVNGRRRAAILSGGAETFTLATAFPGLEDVHVYNGWTPALARPTQALSAFLAALQTAPGGHSLVDRLTSTNAGSDGGPDAETRRSSRSHIVAVARDRSGHVLAEASVDGPSIYDLTAELMAWGAASLATDNTLPPGALGPIEAFGPEGLVAGCAQLGLVEAAGALPAHP